MKKPTHHGFTLIELLLYITIVGILLVSVSVFLGMALQSRIKNQSIIEVNQQGLAIMEYMTQTIRTSTSITSPALGATASNLTVVVPTGALSPTIFDLSGTTLQVKEGAGAAVPLTNSNVQVTSLSFVNVSRSATAKALQISFTLSRTNNNGRNEYTYQKTFTSSVALR